MLALAKYLVQEGLITPQDMDDALQRQVIFGGSLDTNLLELGKLDELILTQALSRVHRLPIVTPELLAKKNPNVANLLPPRLAEKYQVLPVAMSGRNIVVLASARIDPLNEEKLGFILSLKLKTYLVCEARFQEFLSDWLGVFIEPRYKALLMRMGPFNLQPALPTRASPEAIATKEVLSLKEPKQVPIDQAKVKEVLVDMEAAERAKEKKRKEARSGRILTDEAFRTCFQAKHRDVIVDTTLRYARQFMPFVGLFVIDHDHIMGWDAVGSENARALIRKIRIPTRISTVLSMVVNTRAYYLGPMPKSQPNRALLQSLERPYPPNVLLVPIILKKRLIGLLFGDAGNKNIRGNKISELLLFVNILPSAFEQLLLRKKAEAQESIEPALPPTQLKPQAEPEKIQTQFDDWVSPQRTPESSPQAQPATQPGEQIRSETAGEISTKLKEPSPTTGIPEQETAPAKPPDQKQDSEAAPTQVESDLPNATAPAQAQEAAITPDTAKEPVESTRPLTETAHATQPMFQAVSHVKKPPSGQTAPQDEQDLHKQAEKPPPPQSDATPQKQPTESPTPQDDTALEERHIDQLMSQADNALEERQIDQLVEQLVSGVPDLMSRARKDLLDIGPRALEAIMKRFPGILSFDIRVPLDWIPPIAEHSELIRCLIEMGPEACPTVAEKLEDDNPTFRYYALKIFGEVACPKYFDRLAKRLYDRDALIRMSAIDVLHIYRGTPGYKKLLSGLRAKLKSYEPNIQALSAALLGNLKDTLSLPLLAQLVRSTSTMVSRAAVESLRFITKQDFKNNQRKWLKWWKKHKDQQRVQWLIAGLRSKDQELRFSSAQELHRITKEYFDYFHDSKKRDRVKAARRWEEWWQKTGRYQSFDDASPKENSSGADN